MPDQMDKVAGLSAKKRALLEAMLKEKGVDLGDRYILPAVRSGNTMPLSFAQQRLWFLDQLEPGSPSYNIPLALRMTGRLDEAALEKSLKLIAERHESMRTAFAVVDNQPVQVIHPKLKITILREDLSHLDEEEKDEVVLRKISEEAQRPFDLTQEPLFRTRLLELSEQEVVALFTIHHIISDGWSMGVLVRELVQCYQAFVRGEEPDLPALKIQYADFAAWQRKRLQGKIYNEQLEYWRGQLADAPSLLQLPVDHPRPSLQTSSGAILTFAIEDEIHERLEEIGKNHDATLFMTLLAAFQVLLHLYSGQDDICVGSPIANRTRAEIEGLIGFFVNTLVLRADLSNDPTFGEVLNRVRAMALGAYAHQELPFETIVEALRPERDLSHTPFFQVMFILQNATSQALELPDLTIEQIEAHSGTATFDLTMMLSETPDGLLGVMEYNSDLFTPATVQAIIDHFILLLEGIVYQPESKISDLPLLSSVEEKKVLEDWNRTERRLPDGMCIHHLVEEQASRTPDDVALVMPVYEEGERQTLTYSEMNQRANQIAHYLRSQGVESGMVVGICLPRSLDLIVGLLGILKAGAAYLPLDPEYPRDRLQYMLEDTQTPLVLASKQTLEVLPPIDAETLSMDSLAGEFDAQPMENPKTGVQPDDLAYIIYTSGSTGLPKGVLIPHLAVVNHNLAVKDLFALTSEDRVFQFSTINFDAAVEEIFPALQTGCRLVLRGDSLIGGSELLALVEQEGVTVLDLPTAYWHQLVNDLVTVGAELPAVVRFVVVGGEKASREKFIEWWEHGGHRVTWMNTYGPSETTIITTWYEVKAGDESWRDLDDLPIGRPIDNVQVYVLNKYGCPVPVGVSGELVIGGLCLAQGYLNQPERSAERFVPNPFASQFGERLYRTGDLVRWLPIGELEFVGRVDHQVKVRGFRVEPGEIESHLQRHPAIEDALVIAEKDSSGNNALIAYYVPSASNAPEEADLRDYLGGQLPAYMVPVGWVAMECFPLTHSGKVDRRALPEPGDLHNLAEQASRAPQTDEEIKLAHIWQELLGQEEIGAEDHFFEIGGHSLLATQLVSHVRQAFEVELRVRDIFERPTIASQARKIVELAQQGKGLQAPPIVPSERIGRLPLSFAQQRLWFLHQLEPDSYAYHVPDAIRVCGLLDLKALEQSINDLVQRHEVLRTVFPSENGEAFQKVLPNLFVPLVVIDLLGVTPGDREARMEQLIRSEVHRPFDLTRAPLLRWVVVRTKAEEHILLVVMHHIISDGWSTNVLVRELWLLYQDHLQGQSASLPALPVQYADFAVWQRNWLQGEVLEGELDYWRDKLADSPPLLELPTDHPRQKLQSEEGDHLLFDVPEAIANGLRRLSQDSGASLFMTLMAAFQVLLYRYSRQADISVGTPIANRNRAEIEGLIGFFVNTLIVRGDLNTKPSFRQFLTQIRQTTLEAFAHQDVPFEMLVDDLRPQRDLSHTPLFQVMFILQNVPMQDLVFAGLNVKPLELDTHASNFDLTLAMSEEGGQLQGAMEYSTALFEKVTIESMLEHFLRLLEQIVNNPDESVASLKMMAETEREKVLHTWNQTQTAFPQGLCMQHLFERQADKMPEAVAVRMPAYEGQPAQVLTYAQLEGRANQLAHYLRAAGVGANTLVGLCMSRSLEMVVGLLGVLKAGGAYVPLDPAYPEERLQFMIEDSGLNVLLTEETLKSAMPAFEGRLISVDSEWEEIAKEAQTRCIDLSKPENMAYVIYTSGSTGIPKGVMVAHRGVVNHNLAMVEEFGLTAADRVLQFSTINFDAAVEEIFPTWAAGACVVLRPGTLLMSGSELTALVIAEDISVLDFPTAYWHEWVAELEMAGAELPDSLRLVVVGGEKALAERLHAWQRVTFHHQVDWLNTYGPTEISIISCLYHVRHGGKLWNMDEEIPIGKPIANMRHYILDEDLQPVPVGVAGELCVGGPGVALGYLDRPELTAERFIPDPFSDDPDAKLYRTGDLVRYLPDGNQQFMGRVDAQVKVRGFRVELGEIEAALGQHEAVAELVVVAREAENGLKRLVGYVVLHGGSSAVPNDLRQFLKERLPDYMVPAVIMVLDALPKMVNGKVNRAALPAPDYDSLEGGQVYVSARNRKEEVLTGIVCQVLGLDRVGVHDNLFELGADSILGIQIIARANQAGLALSPRQLFEDPTVAGLAMASGDGHQIRAEQGLVEGEFPLTPIQRWFFENVTYNRHHWNQSLMLQVDRLLDRDLLEQTVAHLLLQHDALRLHFHLDDGGWQQVNDGLAEEQVLFWEELPGVADEDMAEAIMETAARHQLSLNIEQGLGLRVVYIDLGEGRSDRLLLVVHHLLMDGVSWRILLEDLLSVYQQLEMRGQAVLPMKTSAFRDWAKAVQGFAQDEAILGELNHWQELVALDVVALPVDFQNGKNTEGSAHNLTVALTEEETHTLLKEIPAVYRVDVQHVLLAALGEAVAQWSGSRQVLVEMEGHGREHFFDDLDITRTVGWFTITYPLLLVIDIDDLESSEQRLQMVKEQLTGVPHRGFGYGLLRYLNQDEAVMDVLKRIPSAEISFNYLGQFNTAMAGGNGISLAVEGKGAERDPHELRGHLLEIDGGVTDGRLAMEFTFSDAVHQEKSIQVLAESFRAALLQFIQASDTVEEIAYVPEDFPLANFDQKQLDKIMGKLTK
jgi:amino acid adenylation domain-containing protein/non-ribosomal peptide synthase protein (TIGR01720 family)